MIKAVFSCVCLDLEELLHQLGVGGGGGGGANHTHVRKSRGLTGPSQEEARHQQEDLSHQTMSTTADWTAVRQIFRINGRSLCCLCFYR